MKTLVVSIIALLFHTSIFAQDTLLRSSIPITGVLKPSYNIGKIDPIIYPRDSVPLFVIKGGGKSKWIRPAKIIELETKDNNLSNAIPGKFVKIIYLFGVDSMPRKYRKEGTYEVWEIHLNKDGVNEVFKLLKDKGYIQ